MEARVTYDGDVTIVSLQGYMDYETSEPFRKTCFQSLLNQKVIFDLEALHFIGSSGLTSFLEILKEFKTKNPLPVKFCGLSREFQRFFWAYEMSDVEIYETRPAAHSSFFQPVEGTIRLQFEEVEESEEGSIEPLVMVAIANSEPVSE